MTITKYLHSCILLEEDGYRLLIDPGEFTFIEGRLKPEDLPAPDAILLTHEHPDHYYPDALRILVRRKPVPIITNRELAPKLEQAGLAGEAIDAGEQHQLGPLMVEAVEAPHGDLPLAKPLNIAFAVNDCLLLLGDSALPKYEQAEVVFLPVSHPGIRLLDALECAQRLKPRLVIPVHDAFVKDFFLQRIYERMCRPFLEKAGVQFRPLGLGESLTLD